MPIGVRITVSTRGPVFSPAAPGLVRDGIDEGLAGVGEQGAQLVRDQLVPGHGYQTGHLHDTIWGGLTRALHVQIDAGLHEHGANVVYAGWIEGTSRRNRPRPGFPGYGVFAAAAARLRTLDTSATIGRLVVRRLT